MDDRRGIALMLAAMACFAVEDAFIKALSSELPAGQIIAVLGALGALVFGALAARRGEALVSREILAPPVALRNLSEMVSTAAYVSALALIPLSMASAILQGVPLVVTMGAALFLGERVGWRRWAAVLVGLCGVLLIVRPGMEGFRPASLLAVVGLVTLAARDLATRRTPASVSSLRLSAWGFASLVPTGLALLLLPGQDAAWPDARAAAFLAGALVVGPAGYWAVVEAMRVGQVSAVAPFRYARLIFALAIAAALLGERPDAATLAGAAIVVASGLYALRRETRRPAPPRPSLTQTEPVP